MYGLDTMDIVPNSYYDHERYGVVKVVSVNNGVVQMEQQENSVVTTAGRIPGGKTQSAAGFQDEAEPADVTIPARPAVFNLDSQR